jgi:hypothetical protein
MLGLPNFLLTMLITKHNLTVIRLSFGPRNARKGMIVHLLSGLVRAVAWSARHFGGNA